MLALRFWIGMKFVRVGGLLTLVAEGANPGFGLVYLEANMLVFFFYDGMRICCFLEDCTVVIISII